MKRRVKRERRVLGMHSEFNNHTRTFLHRHEILHKFWACVDIEANKNPTFRLLESPRSSVCGGREKGSG